VDTALSEVLVFKLFRTETATRTVTTKPIVITPNIIKHRRSHHFTAGKAFSIDAFHLQGGERSWVFGIRKKLFNAQNTTEKDDVKNIFEFKRLCEHPSG